MLVDAIRRFLRQSGITPSPIVVAVSGGGDSTALLIALAELRQDGYTVAAAHVNHHLRGADSDADQAFVHELAQRLEIPLFVADGTLDGDAVRARGIEAAAREVRLERLTEIRERAHSRWIATAHHCDDQAETVLMRLIAGGGIGALRGIRGVRDDGIIRPLLDVTRADVDAFLRERRITPRHDSSNDDPRFLRNRVRVVLRDLGEAASANLAAVAHEAAQQWPHLERLIDDAERAFAKVGDEETRFTGWPEDAWLRRALLHRHIQRLDRDARDVSAADLARLAASVVERKRVSVTRTLELIPRDGAMWLRRRPVAVPSFECELTPETPVSIADANVTLRVWRSAGSAGEVATRTTDGPMRQRFRLPAGAEPRFTVRNRRPGDRFQPLGMTADKKLKDFLIDRKVPVENRDGIALLVWNGEIVWVAGVEISERFKITGGADDAAVYEVCVEPSGR